MPELIGRILRHEVPVDDRWHTLGLSGPVLHVGTRRPDVVEVWALATSGPSLNRHFRVVGTGQPLPDGAVRHIGSAITAGGALVWHLVEGQP